MSSTSAAEGPGPAEAEYSVDLQVAGVFIIAAVSFLGIGFAFVVERVQKGSSGRLLSFLSTLICFLRGAGIGVIISTALVHLINEAYDYFGEEGCNWEEITGYDAWPMVFAMAGMWLISLMEFAHLRLDAMQAKEAGGPAVRESMHAVQLSVRGASAEIDPEEAPDKPAPLVEPMTKYGRTAILVELSILIHSVIVGFDLGLQDVSSWRTLVVAIAFHQFFEGFALGQVILEASFRPLKNWLMIAFFSLTTSVGIAIGIGTSLSPSWEGESPAVAATIGILNSFCGGILLFMGMSIFWTEWVIANKGLQEAESWFLPMLISFGVLVGMTIMGIIGIWA